MEQVETISLNKEIKFNKELETKIQRGIIDTWDSLNEIFPEGFLDNLTDKEVDEYDDFVREKFGSLLDSLELGLMMNDSFCFGNG